MLKMDKLVWVPISPRVLCVSFLHPTESLVNPINSIHTA